ncbi:MAG TPA: transcription elongation factor Spt5 [Methanomassiliicoccales archaeon]|nr:transcription elongation factor Spt5 [Methanomassiliicoccales archaeon]
MDENTNVPTVPEPVPEPVPAQAPAPAPEPQPAAPVASVTSKGGLSLSGESDERKVAAGEGTKWGMILKSLEPGKRKVKLRVTLTIIGVEGSADWESRIYDATERVVWDNAAGPEAEIVLEGSRAKELKMELQAPKGVRYGEGAKAVLEVCPLDSPTACDKMTFNAMARQSIVALKASIGHERQVADDVASKVKAAKSGIYAILSPTTLRGYVLIEGMNTDELKETVRGVRRARGLVEGEMSFAEIDHFLTPKPLVSGIMEGDVVELIAGPFKGEKARVKQIDETKEEITVELFEAMVPIPVTVRGDHVRVLEKEK